MTAMIDNQRESRTGFDKANPACRGKKERMASRACRNCGQPLPARASFCNRCGHAVPLAPQSASKPKPGVLGVFVPVLFVTLLLGLAGLFFVAFRHVAGHTRSESARSTPPPVEVVPAVPMQAPPPPSQPSPTPSPAPEVYVPEEPAGPPQIDVVSWKEPPPGGVFAILGKHLGSVTRIFVISLRDAQVVDVPVETIVGDAIVRAQGSGVETAGRRRGRRCRHTGRRGGHVPGGLRTDRRRRDGGRRPRAVRGPRGRAGEGKLPGARRGRARRFGPARSRLRLLSPPGSDPRRARERLRLVRRARRGLHRRSPGWGSRSGACDRGKLFCRGLAVRGLC